MPRGMVRGLGEDEGVPSPSKRELKASCSSTSVTARPTVQFVARRLTSSCSSTSTRGFQFQSLVALISRALESAACARALKAPVGCAMFLLRRLSIIYQICNVVNVRVDGTLHNPQTVLSNVYAEVPTQSSDQ